MKKKFLVFTLCFTLIFSSLNYKKTYADGGVISLPMLGVISSLAVGSNIIINSNDDIIDIGRLFYNYVDKHNELSWDSVSLAFASGVSLVGNKVNVNSNFLDIVKGFFDNEFSKPLDVGYVPGFDIPYYSDGGTLFQYLKANNCVNFTIPKPINSFATGDTFFYGGLKFVATYYLTYNFIDFDVYHGDVKLNSSSSPLRLNYNCPQSVFVHLGPTSWDSNKTDLYFKEPDGSSISSINLQITKNGILDFPYAGGYSWDNVDNRKDNDSVTLPIPGDLGVLVGQDKETFWDNTDNLVGQGGLTLPGVDSPSINVDSSINTFPSVDVPDIDVPDTDVPGVDSPSVPNEGIWSTIKDFVISLVVPSDTYWTDTWGGLYNNFISSFPMVDMDGFNDLVTGEKKFPNIDINIMGVTGRVVNGDVINSIVNWLRPIIAGFMMLCLMLFNYRKIYKLIRNSEPFGGIAPGTSDFSTGISEYNKESVIKAVDMNAEYHAWKERGGK